MADNDKTTLVLANGSYAYVLDLSKGTASIAVGPFQKSLTINGESPLRLDSEGKLVECNLAQSISQFITAREGEYIILNNPAPADRKPVNGAITAAIELEMGHRMVIPGPSSLPLWPGQSARVIKAHVLRTDQYLVVRIYSEKNAEANKGKGLTYRVPAVKGSEGSTPNELDHPTSLGHSFIVKGTQVSCYIPPTGYEVVPEDVNGVDVFVRTAVTLENLEYCTLIGEDGNRRIEQGPAVVFPQPTEIFVTEDFDGERVSKFRAIELNETTGIYIKVTGKYTETDGTERNVGDELFITGKEQRIYFPRPEHTIVRYGGNTLHYGITIPNGKGRYVVNRIGGGVSLVVGPVNFLPDPTYQVMAQRVLTPKEAALFYPRNLLVAEMNDTLRRELGSNVGQPLIASVEKGPALHRSSLASSTVAGGTTSFDRGTAFTRPRTVTLDDTFDGAVRIVVWPGYAVMVVNGKGDRRVVVGPSTTLLEFDETLHQFSLSTGTPKSDAVLVEGVYLQVTANTVSDTAEVETSDLVPVRVTVAYRVNFEGDNKEKWFSVSNYVALLTTTLRSMLRKEAQKYGVMEFQHRVAEIVRDLILGKASSEGAERTGRTFKENGMRVYDVDVLQSQVLNPQVVEIISRQRLNDLTHTSSLADLERQRKLALAKAEATDDDIQSKMRTAKLSLEAEQATVEGRAQIAKIEQEAEEARQAAAAKARQETEAIDDAIAKAKVEIVKSQDELRLATLKQEVEIQVDAHVKRITALGEKLPEALARLGDTSLLESLSKNLAVQTLLGGDSVVEVLQKALGSGQLADVLGGLFGGLKKAETKAS